MKSITVLLIGRTEDSNVIEIVEFDTYHILFSKNTD